MANPTRTTNEEPAPTPLNYHEYREHWLIIIACTFVSGFFLAPVGGVLLGGIVNAMDTSTTHYHNTAVIIGGLIALGFDFLFWKWAVWKLQYDGKNRVLRMQEYPKVPNRR